MVSNMSETLSGRVIQPGSQKFGKPSHDKLLEVIAEHYPKAEVTSEPRILKKLGFWALIPDLAITVNGKTIFIEIKRQKDTGNAHERLYKFFTNKIMLDVTRALGAETYPVYAILCDGLANNERYRREIEQHLLPEQYLLWKGYNVSLLTDFLDTTFRGRGTFDSHRAV